MGWTNSHLHQFEKDGKHYGVPEDDEFGNLGITDESKFTLDQLLKRDADSLVYVYDFGDDWRHDLVLEKILPAETGTVRPVCLAGERHCPPENVGGAPGYAEFLEAIFDPSSMGSSSNRTYGFPVIRRAFTHVVMLVLRSI
jgi:hypothetical protein